MKITFDLLQIGQNSRTVNIIKNNLLNRIQLKR